MILIVFSTIFSSYFTSITKHSFLCICKVFISKEFVRISYGLGWFYASKRIIQSNNFDANVHAHSVSSVVQRVQCPSGRRWIMCNPFQGSNSLWGANNLFQEIENSLQLSLLKSGPITMLVDKSSKLLHNFYNTISLKVWYLPFISSL